jgi:hypothetical protein
MSTPSPYAGAGTGVSPAGTNYPFILPSAEIRHLLAEAHVGLSRYNGLGLRIVWMAGFNTQFGAQSTPASPATPIDRGGDGPAVSSASLPAYTQAHPADVVIYNEFNQPVFDSTTVAFYRGRALSDRLYSHEWRDTADTQNVVRIVQHTQFSDVDATRVVPSVITPDDGRLDPRTFTSPPSRVSSLSTPSLGAVAGFIGGYNMTYATTPRVSNGIRWNTSITISAEPGGGIGRAPGCTDTTPVLRTINGIGPSKNGAFGIGLDPCYSATPGISLGGGVTTPIPGTLQLHNDCKNPCPPEDYQNLQAALLVLWDQLTAAAATAVAARNQFAGAVTRWSTVAAANANPSLHLIATPHVNTFTNTTTVDVSAVYFNPTAACLSNVTVAFKFYDHPSLLTAFDFTVTVEPNSCFISLPCGTDTPYTLEDDTPIFSTCQIYQAVWPKVMPRGSARIRFRLVFDTSVSGIEIIRLDAGTVPGSFAGSSVSFFIGGP